MVYVCRTCNLIYNGKVKFCPECGSRIEEVEDEEVVLEEEGTEDEIEEEFDSVEEDEESDDPNAGVHPLDIDHIVITKEIEEVPAEEPKVTEVKEEPKEKVEEEVQEDIDISYTTKTSRLIEEKIADSYISSMKENYFSEIMNGMEDKYSSLIKSTYPHLFTESDKKIDSLDEYYAKKQRYNEKLKKSYALYLENKQKISENQFKKQYRDECRSIKFMDVLSLILAVAVLLLIVFSITFSGLKFDALEISSASDVYQNISNSFRMIVVSSGCILLLMLIFHARCTIDKVIQWGYRDKKNKNYEDFESNLIKNINNKKKRKLRRIYKSNANILNTMVNKIKDEETNQTLKDSLEVAEERIRWKNYTELSVKDVALQIELYERIASMYKKNTFPPINTLSGSLILASEANRETAKFVKRKLKFSIARRFLAVVILVGCLVLFISYCGKVESNDSNQTETTSCVESTMIQNI